MNTHIRSLLPALAALWIVACAGSGRGRVPVDAVCPCLHAQVFAYRGAGESNRIAVHVFNLTDVPLTLQVSCTASGRADHRQADVQASSRVFVSFPIAQFVPMQQYEVRVEGFAGPTSKDLLTRILRLGSFDIENLVRLDLE